MKYQQEPRWSPIRKPDETLSVLFPRRALLGATALGVLAACTSPAAVGSTLVLPTDPRVREVESARRRTGRLQTVVLSAQAGPVDLGGPVVSTWTYGGVVPGREIRVRAGDVVEARLVNHLPVDTSVHWHGLALRNDMDGVPGLTGTATAPGQAFTYRFTASSPGT